MWFCPQGHRFHHVLGGYGKALFIECPHCNKLWPIREMWEQDEYELFQSGATKEIVQRIHDIRREIRGEELRKFEQELRAHEEARILAERGEAFWDLVERYDGDEAMAAEHMIEHAEARAA